MTFTDEQMDEIAADLDTVVPQTDEERDLDRQAAHDTPEPFRHLAPTEQADIIDETWRELFRQDDVSHLIWQ